MGPETYGTPKAVSVKKRPSTVQLPASSHQHLAVLGGLGRRVAEELQLEMRAGGLLVLAGCPEST